MKKLLLSIIILMGGGVFYNAFGQQQIPMHIIDNGYFNYGVFDTQQRQLSSVQGNHYYNFYNNQFIIEVYR